MPYCCGQGDLDWPRFLATTLPFLLSVFCFVDFCFIDGVFFILSDHIGAIRFLVLYEDILTLRGKKYGSLIFNPFCSAFL